MLPNEPMAWEGRALTVGTPFPRTRQGIDYADANLTVVPAGKPDGAGDHGCCGESDQTLCVCVSPPPTHTLAATSSGTSSTAVNMHVTCGQAAG